MLGVHPDQSILEQLAEAAEPVPCRRDASRTAGRGAHRDVDGPRRAGRRRELPRRVQERCASRLGRSPTKQATPSPRRLTRRTSASRAGADLGRQPSDLLAPVGELLEANLLVERDEKLAFWHDLTREAVRASVPVTARRALAAQGGGLSCSKPRPCRSKLRCNSRQAPRSVRGRDRNLLEPHGHWPRPIPRQRHLGRRALEIAPAHDPGAGRSSARRRFVAHRGRKEQAIAFADRALRETTAHASGGRKSVSVSPACSRSPGDQDRGGTPRPGPP